MIRQFYSKSTGWGRFCVGIPAQWIAELNEYHQKFEGLECIDVGSADLYLRPALIRGRNPERDYEEFLMTRSELRVAERLSPWPRKAANGHSVTVWYARSRRVGREKLSAVVNTPEAWIRAIFNGRALPKYVEMRFDGGFLIVSLNRSDRRVIEAPEGCEPWYAGRVIPLNVKDLRQARERAMARSPTDL
jgi:hypothetical protein